MGGFLANKEIAAPEWNDAHENLGSCSAIDIPVETA